MAKIALTPTETARIEAVATELDGVMLDFFSDARDPLGPGLWDVLLSYARASIRRALEIGTLLHGVVDARECDAISYPGRGRDVFVRHSLAAWRDSFAPISEIWKLAEIFESIPGGEARLAADVSTLEVMAANRMFDPLDDQCADLLAGDPNNS